MTAPTSREDRVPTTEAIVASVRRPGDRRWATWLLAPFVRIWLLLALLLIVSAIIAPGTMGATALLSMLPFASVLAMAAAGQTLVMQQGGFDLSSAGVISLTAVVVAQLSGGDDDALAGTLVVVLVIALVAGLVNGLAVSALRITPLIATLATNSLLTGVVFWVTGGNLAQAAPPALTSLVSSRVLGLQLVTWIPIVVIVVITVILRVTVVGRRFEAIGSQPATARAMGLRVRLYQCGAYIAAALCYASAGVLLAGFIARPDLLAGQDYLLLTIAAVAIGGTPIGGGRGSVVATAIGAVFLVQLGQLVQAIGAPASVQFVIQGAALIGGIALARLADRVGIRP